MFNKDLDREALITWALERHVPFQLEVPRSQLHRFQQQFSTTERDLAFFYKHGQRIDAQQYTAENLSYCVSYRSRVVDLLARPNARAFLFEGDLISRIARAYASDTLIERVLFGPSAQVTLHNSGYSDIDRLTQ